MQITEPRLSREALPAFLVLLGMSYIFCYPAGGYLESIPIGGDAITSYFPSLLRAFQPTAGSGGAFDDSTATGLPVSHSPNGCYYPPLILLFTIFPATLAYGLGVVLHHAWAGLGTYVLARTTGQSRPAAYLAAVVFAFGGFLFFHQGHNNIHQSAAWLPWVLWAFEQFRRSNRMAYAVLAGTFMALQALPGHPQMVVLGGVVWLIYLGYFLILGPGVPTRLRFTLAIASACLLGALGSLPQTLPMTEVASWSHYRQFEQAFFESGSLKFRFLPGLLGPYMLGGWDGVELMVSYWGPCEHGIYSGLMPLALTLVLFAYFWLRRQAAPSDPATPPPSQADPMQRFWLVLLFSQFILMLGSNTPLYRLMAWVPLYNFFHIPTRHVWGFGLALALLGGLGLDTLIRSNRQIARRLLGRAAVVLLLCWAVSMGILFTSNWPGLRPSLAYCGFWQPLSWSVAVVLFLAALSHWGWRHAFTLVPLFAFAELYWNLKSDGASPTQWLTERTQFPEAIAFLRQADEQAGPPRCLIQPASWPTTTGPCDVPATYGSAWGLSVMNPYSQSLPRSLGRLITLDRYGAADFARALAEQRGLSAVGARYLITTGAELSWAPGRGTQKWRWNDINWNGIQSHDDAVAPRFIATEQGRISTLRSLVSLEPGQTFLYHAEFSAPDGLVGPLQVRMLQPLPKRQTASLGHWSLTPQDLETRHPSVTGLFQTLPDVPWLNIEMEAVGSPQLLLQRFDLWLLTPEFAAQVRDTEASEIHRQLQASSQSRYPLLGCFAGNVRVLENPAARSLATLVTEVRPARSDLDAAELTLAGERDVRDLAHVVAPAGKSHDLDLSQPRHFARGTAEICSYRPDAIEVRTAVPDDGFLVFAITKCRGWTATIDGQEAAIHAVDGPLMGVRVPPGDHVVRLHFRPVLVQAGTLAAVLSLGGAWLVVLGCWLANRMGLRAHLTRKLVQAAPSRLLP